MSNLHKKILCIDGNWIGMRNFHASNKAIIEDPEDTKNLIKCEYKDEIFYQDYNHLVTSIFQSILKVIRDYEYEYQIIVLFDRGSYKYRDKKKFTQYKATREYNPLFDCCWNSLNYIREFLPSIGIQTIQIPGVEADDLGMYYSVNSDNCVLYTSDRDWLQSVTTTTELHRPVKGETEINTFATVYESDEMVKTPEDFALLKSLEGDISDNIEALPKDVRENFGNLKNKEIMELYKNDPSKLDIELFEWINSNLQLSRLDHILKDTETQVLIRQIEEDNTKKYVGDKNDIQMLQLLSDSDINFLSYFLGVLGKYNRLHN